MLFVEAAFFAISEIEMDETGPADTIRGVFEAPANQISYRPGIFRTPNLISLECKGPIGHDVHSNVSAPTLRSNCDSEGSWKPGPPE